MGVVGLEPESRRRRRVRQAQTALPVVQRIQALREQYPRWGRERLRVLLEREGIHLSSKSIDRVIARLEARGVLREPLRPGNAARWHQERLRRPPGLAVDHPGALVQMDTKQVAAGPGKVVYQFGAVDCFSWKRVVAKFPFAVEAVQSDGGAEFLKDFGSKVEELKLTHYFNRPNYPQGNGCIERSLRTDDEEFYQVEELPADLGGLEAALVAWNQIYEQVRSHQALGYRTPEQF